MTIPVANHIQFEKDWLDIHQVPCLTFIMYMNWCLSSKTSLDTILTTLGLGARSLDYVGTHRVPEESSQYNKRQFWERLG